MNSVHGLVNLLDSREKAAVFWLVILLTYAIVKAGREVASPLGQVVHALLGWKLMLVFGSAAAYCAVLVFGASRLGLWHTTAAKETAYWYFTGAVALVGRSVSHANPSDPGFYKSLVRHAIKWTIVIEFLVNLYVFPLALELILMPFFLLFLAMQVYLSYDPTPGPVGPFVNVVLGLGGIFLMSYAIAAVIADPSRLFTRENVETLLVAPAFTVAFIPFVWMWGWISWREQRNIRRRLQIQYDASA
jgi:hypothetical protein